MRFLPKRFFIFLAPLLAALSLASALPALAQINAEQVLAIGKNVLSMDDYMLSIQYFNQAIKAKPYLPEPYYLRALAKMNLEDFQGAIDDCSECIRLNKFLTDAFRLRGFCLVNTGRDSLAIQDFNVGLKYFPDDKFYLFYKSVAQMQINDTTGADSTFTRLLELYPSFDEAYTARARMRYLRGDTVGALADVEKSIELSKDILNNYLLQADIYLQRSDWKNGARALDEIIRLEPKNPDMYINRAFVRYNIDNLNGALADYNYALELNPENLPAVYNRALLRYEVRDFNGAFDDFSKVIKADPGNFHALYNRALISLDLRRWKQAIADFTAISKKYPKFYPIYYGIAQAKQALGDQNGAIKMVLYAEDMVRKYVDNPKRNPLDRPTIQPGIFNNKGMRQDEDEDDLDVMERFNRLITIDTSEETTLQYDDKIKGRVQDREMKIELEPMFALSLFDGRTSLRPTTNYFNEIEELNRRKLLPGTLYVTNTAAESLSEERADELFSILDTYNANIASGNARPVDYLGRAVTNILLKNYRAAVDDLDKAIELNPNFTAAWLARAYAKKGALLSHDPAEKLLPYNDRDILADLDKALALNPRLIYAIYNKGNVLYAAGDFTSALAQFSKALEINPEFAEALYNRGLTYLALGNREKAFTDLSRAGELGILPSYRVLKNMK